MIRCPEDFRANMDGLRSGGHDDNEDDEFEG